MSEQTSEESPNWAICAEGLFKRFGLCQALNGLSLHVPEGAFYALLSPNGAGKSTSLAFLPQVSHGPSAQRRLPLPVTLGGIAAAAVGIASWSWMVSSLQGHRPSWPICIALPAVALLYWVDYGVLWPSLTRPLEHRKEAIWKAVTRA